MLKRFEETFGEPKRLVRPTPTLEEAKAALVEAQNAAVIAHGHGGAFTLGGGMEEAGFTVPDIADIERGRNAKGYRKMGRVYLQYCDGCIPEAVAAWKRVANEVIGWDHEFSLFGYWFNGDYAKLW